MLLYSLYDCQLDDEYHTYVPEGSLELQLEGDPVPQHARDCHSAGRQMAGPLGNTLIDGSKRVSLTLFLGLQGGKLKIRSDDYNNSH